MSTTCMYAVCIFAYASGKCFLYHSFGKFCSITMSGRMQNLRLTSPPTQKNLCLFIVALLNYSVLQKSFKGTRRTFTNFLWHCALLNSVLNSLQCAQAYIIGPYKVFNVSYPILVVDFRVLCTPPSTHHRNHELSFWCCSGLWTRVWWKAICPINADEGHSLHYQKPKNVL